MRRSRRGIPLIVCWGLCLGSIGCVATGARTFPASTRENFAQIPGSSQFKVRGRSAGAWAAGSRSVEAAENAPIGINPTLLRHYPDLARHPGYFRAPVTVWTRGQADSPGSAGTVAEVEPDRFGRKIDEEVAEKPSRTAEDEENPPGEEAIPVLHVHIRFDPIPDDPPAERASVASVASKPQSQPRADRKQKERVEEDREPVSVSVSEPVAEAKAESAPVRERPDERKVSYDIETPSADDPSLRSRPLDFAIAETDAPPRRRDARSVDPNRRRNPRVALTDAPARLLFPRTYFESAERSRPAPAVVDSEPDVRQAAWRSEVVQADSTPASGSRPKVRRGWIRRSRERLSRLFGPPAPIAR